MDTSRNAFETSSCSSSSHDNNERLTINCGQSEEASCDCEGITSNSLSNGYRGDVMKRAGDEVIEITLLSPSSPPQQQHHSNEQSSSSELFAHKLQMKLKSHLLLGGGETNSNESYNDTPSTTEIFYDFDEGRRNDEEELTSDYGTGGSNSTIVDDGGDDDVMRRMGVVDSSGSSNSSDSSVIITDQNNVEESSKADEDDDDEEGGKSRRNVRYQRSSSLKSGKTPPGTPMKKIVRFADAMGLDLIDIKVFMDEIPRIPKEAYRDLHIPDYNNGGPSSSSSSGSNQYYDFLNRPFGLMSLSSNTTARGGSSTSSSSLNFVPLFHQPVTMPDFFDKIRDRKVLLENAYLTQETDKNLPKHVIKGTVRVMNLDFHKSVYVRYTYNDWKEFCDFQTTYIPGSCDGFSDRFEFRIEIDETKLPQTHNYNPSTGQLDTIYLDDAKISFACRFHCQGSQFWDNNQSRNYVFQNVPIINSNTATPPSTATGSGATTHHRLYGFGSSSSRYSSFDDFDYEDVVSTVAPPVATEVVQKPTTDEHTTQQTTCYNTQIDNFTLPQQPKLPQNLSSATSSSTNSCGYYNSTGGAASSLVGVVSSGGGGGGSHLSGSLYSPVGFYESAYGCYNSSQYGSACFY